MVSAIAHPDVSIRTADPPADWPLQGQWSYDDYARLPDNGFRYEVIEGNLYMSPAPRPKHQRATLKLAAKMDAFVEVNSLGKVYPAPVDLLLPDLANPVQPDVLFVRSDRLAIVKEAFIEGVPDLVVEVLSPGSVWHDRRRKFHLYARAGVNEYWIVDPDERTVEVFLLRGEAYVPLGMFRVGEEAHSKVIAGFTAAIDEICPPQ